MGSPREPPGLQVRSLGVPGGPGGFAVAHTRRPGGFFTHPLFLGGQFERVDPLKVDKPRKFFREQTRHTLAGGVVRTGPVFPPSQT